MCQRLVQTNTLSSLTMTNTNTEYTNMVLVHPMQLNTAAGTLLACTSYYTYISDICIKYFAESGPNLLLYMYMTYSDNLIINISQFYQ